MFALRTYDLELDNNIVSYNPFVSNYLLSYLLYDKIINYTYTVMCRQEEYCQQFVSEFGYIGRSVVLQDPNGNQIEVSVEKEYGDFFFKDRWMGLLYFYKLILGVWLTISYCDNCLFFIGVINRSRIEIKYMKYTLH